MTNREDQVIERLANLRTVKPSADWEKRVRARCHSKMTLRQAPQSLRLVDCAALAVLCLYLSAVLQAASRLSGVL
ncbi:hypothetical protein [Bryobacter aggregatus]|uniref:hypothetical protein n=1 Tax=Bryobacter aggregatus TaxID=360054 RepID=UPI0004E1A3F3|nr:hypothetical protein [Bryobacter aggregatus]